MSSVFALFPIDTDDSEAHLQTVAVNVAQNSVAVDFWPDFLEPIPYEARLFVALTGDGTHARH